MLTYVRKVTEHSGAGRFSTFVTDNDISSIGSQFYAMTPDSIALAECCEDQKIRGPLLVIASSLTVSEDALSWEKALGTTEYFISSSRLFRKL